MTALETLEVKHVRAIILALGSLSHEEIAKHYTVHAELTMELMVELLLWLGNGNWVNLSLDGNKWAMFTDRREYTTSELIELFFKEKHS